MFNPVSTYRVQFHVNFNFSNFEAILPYLQRLGIQTIYASPIFEAVPGSVHGYDTTNPLRINPEIGTEEDLLRIAMKLKKMGISWIQDIVPNHMAYHSNNLWLMDVLENGAASAYASFFDINWAAEDSPLMVPFLGGDLEQVLENKELKLLLKKGKPYLDYAGNSWPVNAASLAPADLNKAEIERINKNTDELKAILHKQHYRLCNWQETNERINYRRFFTVNGLICLNMQEEETFTAYHAYIQQLVAKGLFQGLRVDHIDGLKDPEAYLHRLRQMVGDEVYLVVEKILEKEEPMPQEWPTQGNTGYEMLALINNLFTNGKAKKGFKHLYVQLTGDGKKVETQIFEKKSAVLFDHMQGELEHLYQLFTALEVNEIKKLKVQQPESIKQAIAAFLVRCPVYRFYGNAFPLEKWERKAVEKILDDIAQEKQLKPVAEVLKEIWLNTKEGAGSAQALNFYMRCMQFAGPLMAKGVEDTLMYTYQNFIAHNEVGDAPDGFGISTRDMHQQMKLRQKYWPLSMTTTATHDTKRGEDFRARLNVLSDLEEEWKENAGYWFSILPATAGESPLTDNDKYFIFQTLIGSYPMPGNEPLNYPERLKEYLEKALREGKQHSDWAEPNLAYEEQATDFALGLLDKNSAFWTSFCAFHRKVSDFGILNSLSQLVLKFMLPGLPDVYQGNELWDLSFVDPDNRSAVDYAHRLKLLKKIEPSAAITQLWAERYQGSIKLALTQRLLAERKLKPDLYLHGAYIPLKVKGNYASNVFAFARRHGDDWVVTAVALHMAAMLNGQYDQLLEANWEDTTIILPDYAPETWENLIDGGTGKAYERTIAANLVFQDFPLAVLKMNTRAEKRSAGLLMHITSLPSDYGIGDFGKEARKFIKFLSRSGQRYWQLLPLNPIGEAQSYSPYSSVSSMAGNVWLVSPDLLYEQNLLGKDWLKLNKKARKNAVDFKSAGALKEEMFDLAYENFLNSDDAQMKKSFERFCLREDHWLADFAKYSILKLHFENEPWYKWPEQYKLRNAKALKTFEQNNAAEIKKVKWKQFVFFEQWGLLKLYARHNGVQLFGDLPFYVGHDSADVWANPNLFKLDGDGQAAGIAGVPPDYFNAEGQLWGMPVYNWEALKSTGYKWWLERIAMNLKLYDLLRLDHFRAFVDYWEVAATELTAKNGSWKAGPGTEFFRLLKTRFPQLPFVAEDLGEINTDVYLLRDEFALPGMKVLQFAFGEDIASSVHIPYHYESVNFVAYTGTHDNNTTVGWYKNDLDKDGRQRLKLYAGKVNRYNVHEVLIKTAMASCARLVMIPIQDLLGLSEQSRMNIPASNAGNWSWCLSNAKNYRGYSRKLIEWLKVYGRI
ncbi:malto-oligosyltrehalose synthase [Pedobacter sp. MC2016-14]|uniref:malto-oligosyltrehalose synthase n=1 Tax=Pedobacter sp. MC2016-14 TaxID=2897327 RepID=UPI001E464D73|nr:malto-oligosyltrehalose synthase [Pedobacter sp. MC2016-14]MCD0489742.1 malto-oligosyltrehalose synthase [Pedobacter sp. MC2016-14]